MPIYAIIALIIALGGGASFAAESSLPGDALYPIKINVNETIRAGLAVSTESKAEVAAALAERRLMEAERLAAEGKLSAEAGADLEFRFKSHADKAEELIAKLEAEGKTGAAANISAALQASLEAREQALVSAQAGGLLQSLRVEMGDVTQAKASAEAKIAATGGTEARTAAQGKLTALENKIAEVKNFIDVKGSVDAEASAAAQAKLQAALQVMAQGKAQLDAGAYGDAFVSFSQAFDMAADAQASLAGGIRASGAGTDAEAGAKGKLKINIGL